MHPLLASKKRLFIYLLSWAPVVNLLSHALTAAANIAYLDAVLVTAPACVLFALICLSPYYLGRVLPARLADLPRIVGIHLTAGVVSSLLLVGVIELLLVVILRRAGVPYDSRFAARFPLVIGVGMLLYSLSVALHYAVL